MSIDVFVSHSKSDRTLAAVLVDVLRSCVKPDDFEIRCSTIAQGAPEPGVCFDEAAVRKEVESAKVFIWLATKSAVSSAPVLFEVTTRRHSDLQSNASRVWPIVVDPKLQLPWPFTHLQSVPCQNWEHLEKLLQRVAERLGRAYERNRDSIKALCDIAELSLKDRDALLTAIVTRDDYIKRRDGLSPSAEG